MHAAATPQLIGGLVVPKFRDVTQQAGVATTVPDASCGDFVTGAAWGDVNGDGWLDLFVARIGLQTQLFVNDKHGHFTADQAAQYGVQVTGAIAAVFADFGNDGKDDLYVARTGPDVLFHNDGNGHFTDITAASGISDTFKGSSVSVADYDNDGHLDIYVTNYAECGFAAESFFNYQPDKLYHNKGDGTFTDVASLLGVIPATGAGLTLGAGFQAAWFDANGDGRQDLYLGNDYLGPRPDHNRFWMNMGPGADGQWQFVEDSVPSGTAFSMNTMGIAIGDYDRDLKLDFALSNIRYNRLLRNNGDETFSDLAVDAKVDRRYDQSSTQVPVTWAAAFYDFNLDGWEDLHFAAGNFRQALDQSNEPQPDESAPRPHAAGSTTRRKRSTFFRFFKTCFLPDGHVTVNDLTFVCWPSPKSGARWLPEATLVDPQNTSRSIEPFFVFSTMRTPQPSRAARPTGLTSSQWRLPIGVTFRKRWGVPPWLTTKRSILPSRS